MNAPQTVSAQPRIGALIRARRRQMDMTLQALGDAAGLSVGFLSQVERDQASPSLGALAGIARGLGVDIEYFVATPSAGSGTTRSGERSTFSLPGSSIVYERLHTEFPGRGLSSYIKTVAPGHRSEMVHHEGDELLYVLEGEITQTVDGEVIKLGAGDSLHFRGSSDHGWANETDRPARILWTGTLSVLQPRQEGGLEMGRNPKPAEQSAGSKTTIILGRTKP